MTQCRDLTIGAPACTRALDQIQHGYLERAEVNWDQLVALMSALAAGTSWVAQCRAWLVP